MHHDDIRERWTLDFDMTFLNHGSFGATPKVVLAAQTALRAQMEREPVRFFVRELEPLLDDARRVLAGVVGASEDALVFVPNATFAVNSVLRSLDLQAGDEILVTDHGYNACRNVAELVAERSGAKVVVAKLPFEGASPERVHAAIMSAVSERTKIALIDHVTSPTALVMPLARLVPDLEARGVLTLVDGAHGIGMFDLDLEALRPAFYTSNCHKWLCAPKGAAFLYARDDVREACRPAVVSHGANARRVGRSRYHLEFDWIGTVDPTPWLCVPAAVEFMDTVIPGGMAAVREHNHGLALEARALLADALDLEIPCPDEMIGSLAALRLPSGEPFVSTSSLYSDPLQTALFERNIEVPIVPWPAAPHRLVRVSAQLYNRREDYARLAEALKELL